MRAPMTECQVQRTLVKSPPELWEALSDPAALARHLGEFGEIRITRLEPETTVEWEGDRASGTVQIIPSGWGTKVTLTATPAVAEPESEAARTTTAMVVWKEPAPFPPPPAPEAEPEAVLEPEPTEETPEEATLLEEPRPEVPEAPPIVMAPRRSWFQRLFGRVALEVPTEPEPPAPAPNELPVEPDPDVEDDPPPAAEVPLGTMEPDVPTVEFSVESMWEGETEPLPEPDPQPEPQPDPEPIPSIDGERATAVLTSVLDDLGAAHHRPFSR